MNKRLVIVSIIFLGLAFITLLVHDYIADKEEGNRIPSYLNSYPDIGYFKINPGTILESLSKGDNNIFVPLLEDPHSVQSLTNVSFFWTQADFLKIVNSLGMLIWNDPMEFTDWGIYDYYFHRSCQEGPDGFDYGSITFFKTIVVNGRKVYTTRHIEIDPYGSMVRWGSGATYSRPIFYEWNDFNANGINIMAEHALRILEEHGGEEARQKIDNRCMIMITTSVSHDKWDAYYIPTGFSARVDPRTGEYEIFRKSP